jgi:hypothetical protein
VSSTGVQLAMDGSAVGGTMALMAPPRLSGRRAVLPVNVAALASVANGASAGRAVAHRPTPAAASPIAWHTLPVEEVLRRLRSCDG